MYLLHSQQRKVLFNLSLIRIINLGMKERTTIVNESLKNLLWLFTINVYFWSTLKKKLMNRWSDWNIFPMNESVNGAIGREWLRKKRIISSIVFAPKPNCKDRSNEIPIDFRRIIDCWLESWMIWENDPRIWRWYKTCTFYSYSILLKSSRIETYSRT